MKKLEAARQSHGRKRLELLYPSYCAGKEACNAAISAIHPNGDISGVIGFTAFGMDLL
ncbi:MAG: hypothetical protein U1D41_02840 [Nitrosomonas sp.]|uniref:hypothetical protein n=1 Tax=Nitrosomonas sp. TaxID=42353 RepID=UPI002730A1AE|nr:hypothetical protein [Nitrosomonas sp.]MBK6958282.1 hypothetical protein [Nitrosomonas sp.]MDP1787157.1 hypothetical protein [Nitrosomonas sp.]MDP3664225.1 hypothetical protein [Nitrosomonas sp.]MDZ4105096.1 hypothetical protein [Nitrosomonas sp.]